MRRPFGAPVQRGRLLLRSLFAVVAALAACTCIAPAAQAAFSPYYLVGTASPCVDNSCGTAGALDAAGSTIWVALEPDTSYPGGSTVARLARFDLADVNPKRPEEATSARQAVPAPGPGIDDLAMAADGALFVLRAGEVHRYSAAGQLLGSFSAGGASGDRIAVGPDGSVYVPVVDFDSASIQRYTATGDPQGPPFGSFELDVDLAPFGAGIAVCDSGSGAVSLFGSDGAPTGTIGPVGVATPGSRCASGFGSTMQLIAPTASVDPYRCAEPVMRVLNAGGLHHQSPLTVGNRCIAADGLAVAAGSTLTVKDHLGYPYLVRLDESPPVMTAMRVRQYTSGPVTVAASATDVGSGKLAVEASADGGPFTVFTPGESYDPLRTIAAAGVTITGAEGPHRVSGRVRDEAGHVSNVMNASVILDKTAPRTTAVRVRARVPKRWRRYLRGRPRVYTRGVRPVVRSFAEDALAGVELTRLAIRLKDPRGRCAWWNARNERFVGLDAKGCQLGGKAGVSLNGSLQLSPGRPFKFGGKLTRLGRYTIYVQAADRADNREGGSRPLLHRLSSVSFRIVDSKGLRRSAGRRPATPCAQVQAKQRRAKRSFARSRRALRSAGSPAVRQRLRRVVGKRRVVLRRATARVRRTCR